LDDFPAGARIILDLGQFFNPICVDREGGAVIT